MTENQTQKSLKQPEWALWFITNKHKDWSYLNVNSISIINLVNFKCVYLMMKLPSELTAGDSYCVFKDKIRPSLEDPANKCGGRWIIYMHKQKDELDSYWFKIVVLLLKGSFKNNDQVLGAVVNAQDRSEISIWMADTSKMEENLEVARKVEMELSLHGKMHFLAHQLVNEA